MHTVLERPLSALDAIFTRRSIRAYRPQALDEQTVRSLLDAAVQAPTAMHAEPWSFVVVQHPQTACALGLGTCCIGSAIPALNAAETKTELALPDDVEAVAPVVVGIPSEAGAAVERREPLVLSWIGKR